MSEAKGVEAVMKSLTGFDEILIRERFGGEVNELPPLRLVRSLLFIEKARESLATGAVPDHKEIYREVMMMTVGEVDGAFAAEEDDEEDSGKD